MGRNIPSMTHRLEAKIHELERFSKSLAPNEQEAFNKLMKIVKDRRSALDAADEDLEFAILLTIVTYLESVINDKCRQTNTKEPQSRLTD